MNFRGAGKGRRKRAEATIEITSLIDVVFLLLIFLLVTTTFKKNEHAFIIDLPTSSSEQVTVTTDKTTVFITETGEFYYLEVAADGGGDSSKQKVTAMELRQKLMDLHARKSDAAVSIRGEQKTSYQKMMDVVSTLQDIGFSNIWFPYERDGEP